MFQKKEVKPGKSHHKDKRTSTDLTPDEFSKPEFLPIITHLIKDESTCNTDPQLACETIPSDDEDFEKFDSNFTKDSLTLNKRQSREFIRSASSPSKENIGRPRGFSALSKLLTESAEQYNNPFREYSRFDGEGQTASHVRKINIFVWPYGMEKPKFSVLIHVLAQRAKV